MKEAAPKTRQVVVITGASAAIGAALARVFAEHGHDLVLIARREAKLDAQYIVNNAGFGLVGEAAQLDHPEQLAMIDLNIRFLTELSLAFVDTLSRLRGGILNVASVAGFLPGPGMAVYYATKAYVLSFSEALHHELMRHG